MEELRKCKERMFNRMEADNIVRTQVREIEILMEDSLQDVSVPVEVIELLGLARSVLDKADINYMPVSEDRYRASQVYPGHRGRPLYDIRKEQLHFFIENYFTSRDMATLLGVSRRTVERRLANFSLTHWVRFSDISDHELISMMHSMNNNFPRSEYGMDPDAQFPEPSDEDNIDVPSIELLNEEQLHSFNAKMRGIQVADLSVIEPYLHALDSVDEVLEV